MATNKDIAERFSSVSKEINIYSLTEIEDMAPQFIEQFAQYFGVAQGTMEVRKASVIEVLNLLGKVRRPKTITDIPPELQQTILMTKGLNTRDIGAFCSTNKQLTEICRDPMFWRGLAKARGYKLFDITDMTAEEAKEAYVEALTEAGDMDFGSERYTSVDALITRSVEEQKPELLSWYLDGVLEMGYPINITKLLLQATKSNNVYNMDILVKYNMTFLLLKSLNSDSLNLLPYFIQKGANLNIVFKYAIEIGNVEAIRLLLSLGAVPSGAVLYAVGNNLEIIDILISAGGSLDLLIQEVFDDRDLLTKLILKYNIPTDKVKKNIIEGVRIFNMKYGENVSTDEIIQKLNL